MQHHQVLHRGLRRRIKITDNAIIPMKERVADRRHDPLRHLFRSWRAPGTS